MLIAYLSLKCLWRFSSALAKNSSSSAAGGVFRRESITTDGFDVFVECSSPDSALRSLVCVLYERSIES